MGSIRACDLPAGALLTRYRQSGVYTDCYVAEVARPVSHSEYVEAFYTTALFKLERMLLAWLISRPSTDRQVRELAEGKLDTFAAWTVEARSADQLLLCDYQGKTRSWLMTVPDPVRRTVQLYFGSAVLPDFGRALLGFHRLYSRLLLRGAVRRLADAG